MRTDLSAVERVLKKPSAKSPEETYYDIEYLFLRMGIVSSPQEFWKLPIPCVLDMLERINTEIKEQKKAGRGLRNANRRVR